MEKTCVFKSKDDMKRLVTGVVLEPDTIDAQDDTISAEDVEKAAHGYLKESRVVGDEHMFLAEDVHVVESYIAPVEFAVGDETVRKGSWVMTVHVVNDALWEGVLKGEYTGFSIGGSGYRTPIE